MQISSRHFSDHTQTMHALVLTASALLTSGAAVAQTPGDQAGVFANGSVSYLFRICSTCPQPTGVLDSQSAGGFGSTGPAVVDGLGVRGTAVGSFSARARTLGPTAVPELKADARATPGVGPHPGFSEDGVYDLNALAIATGRQYYTYTGSTTQTFTMSYSLSGFASSTLPNPTPADESLIGIAAVISLFDDGDKLGGELPLGRVVDIDRVNVNGSAGTFRQSGSVSITLDPGDAYYLVASLSAQVSIGGQGIADAGQTLTIAFTEGDTSQLGALLSPVPEPTSPALLGLGLALTLLHVRRKAQR